jgi:hypothetical protein
MVLMVQSVHKDQQAMTVQMVLMVQMVQLDRKDR